MLRFIVRRLPVLSFCLVSLQDHKTISGALIILDSGVAAASAVQTIAAATSKTRVT